MEKYGYGTILNRLGGLYVVIGEDDKGGFWLVPKEPFDKIGYNLRTSEKAYYEPASQRECYEVHKPFFAKGKVYKFNDDFMPAWFEVVEIRTLGSGPGAKRFAWSEKVSESGEPSCCVTLSEANFSDMTEV